MKTTISVFLLFALLLTVAHSADAKRITLDFGTQVQTRSDETFGNVQLLQFDLPSELVGKRVDTVLLEFYVDASLSPVAADSDVPILAVAPLAAAASVGNALSVREQGTLVRHVRVGAGRRVTLDITDMARAWLEDAETNHGIVIGAITGTRSGQFTVRDGVLGAGVKARVTVFYQNRSGERVSAR